MKKEKKLLLGAHMSISESIDLALIRGASIGCTSIQIFTHSNRQWAIKKLNKDSIDKFLKAKKETGIDSIVSHASYLINLCSSNKDTLQKSLITLLGELEHCNKLEIEYLVLHPGSANGKKEETIIQLSDSLNNVFSIDKSNVMILIELMAGQGNSIGSSFEELQSIIENVKNKDRIGVCFDTCHAWAAGYDFSDEKKYKKMWHDFDKIIGLEKLKVIHMNDSKKELGSNVDRHENIGKGKLGLEAFRLIMNDKHFDHIPKLLETPKTDLKEDQENMKILKSLII